MGSDSPGTTDWEKAGVRTSGEESSRDDTSSERHEGGGEGGKDESDPSQQTATKTENEDGMGKDEQSGKILREIKTIREKQEEIGRSLKQLTQLPGKLEEMIQEFETRLDEAESLVEDFGTIEQELNEDEEALAVVLQEITKQLSKDRENLKETVEGAVAYFRNAVQKARDDYEECAEHFKETTRQTVGEASTIDERVGRAIGEFTEVRSELADHQDKVEGAIETLKKQSDEWDKTLDRAVAAANTLDGAIQQENIEKLERVGNESAKRLVELTGELEDKQIDRIESRMNTILNLFDERRKRVSRNLDKADNLMSKRLSEVKATRAVVEEYEQKIEKEISNLVKETKAITARRAFYIFCATFLGVIVAVGCLQVIGMI